MEIEKRIPEFVIVPNQIKQEWSDIDDLLSCWECKSSLFYVKIDYGIVAEDHFYMVMGNRSKRTYHMREVGFSLYCAKCGSFLENYTKYFFPEDKLILFDLSELLDEEERLEVENCLTQFNQKGNFESRYSSNIFIELKKKLIEYEKKYPKKCQISLKKKRKK